MSANALCELSWMSGVGPYRGAAEIGNEIEALAQRGAALETYGHSVEGRELVAMQLGDPNALDLTILMAGVHAMEWIGVEVLLAAVRLLLDESAPKNRVWVVPVVNVDGFSCVESDLREGRRVFRRGNSRGVDLNRNWPTHFRKNLGRTPLRKWLGHTGPAACSEPEVSSIVARIDKERARGVRVVRALSLHSFGRAILFPFGGRWAAPDVPEQRAAYQETGERVNTYLERSYRVVQCARWFPGFFANGMEIDHFHEGWGAHSILIECSGGGFRWLRPSSYFHPFRWFNPPEPGAVVAELAPAVAAFCRGSLPLQGVRDVGILTAFVTGSPLSFPQRNRSAFFASSFPMVFLLLGFSLAGCDDVGPPLHPWMVIQDFAVEKGYELSGPQLGSRNQVVWSLGKANEETLRISVWPPGSDGPAFTKVGNLRLTFERGARVGVTPPEVQEPMLRIKEKLEAHGCLDRSGTCFRALYSRTEGGASSADNPASPIRDFLPWMWFLALAGCLYGGFRNAEQRSKTGLRMALVLSALVSLLAATLAGPHGFLVENFRAGTVIQEALRSDHTSVHGDSIYALFGLAMDLGGLDESWLFTTNLLCAAFAILLLGLLLTRLGFQAGPTIGAMLLLGLHPLWLRYAATEALVVPNTLLWVMVVGRVLMLPGLYGRRDNRSVIFEGFFDALVFSLALGGRPELVGATLAMVVCGVFLHLFSSGRRGPAIAMSLALLVACLAHLPRFTILTQAAQGEYLGRYPGYGPSTWGHLEVHWLVGAPIIVLMAILAFFWKPERPGLRLLGWVAWLAALLPHLHIFEGPLAGSHLRLTAQTLAPMAFLSAAGFQWLLPILKKSLGKFPAWGILLCAVISQPMWGADTINPKALETQQGEVARALLCAYEGPPLRFVAMPRRSDDVGVLLPATSSHFVEACFRKNPAFLSLTDVTRKRVRLRAGERGLIWLDATCDLEVLDDFGVYRAQPVAGLCDYIENEMPVDLLDRRDMDGAIIKPSRRPRDETRKIQSRLYLLEGPWPRSDSFD